MRPVSTLVLCLCCCIFLSFAATVFFPDEERKPQFWFDLAQRRLQSRLSQRDSTSTARNLLLFIGDGMGLNTITATRILKGQLRGGTGEEFTLAMDTFPYTALSKTYCTDAQIADSTCAATALLCGVKTNKFTAGLSAGATYDRCNTSDGHHVTSILRWAKDAGKSVGFVTTVRVQHATLAPAYAHTPNRYWYSDANMPAEQRQQGCKDIAHQLVHNIPDIEVIMGGGRKYMTPAATPDPEYPSDSRSQGLRLDGVNLIQKWKDLKPGKNATYVWNKADLDRVDPDKTDYLLALFEPGDMSFELERNNTTDPSLPDMTDVALKILRKNPKGFFLLVEGGQIDPGHHQGKAKLALYETMLLDEAVERAALLTSESDTLTVVSADHSHTLSLGGYTDRGNPIFGFGYQVSDVDGMPYTALSYGNGPGFSLVNGSRRNPQMYNTSDHHYQQQSAVPLIEETHSGEDVPVFARGPWAHLFRGTNEDTFIAHAMAYAACLGRYASHCIADLPKVPAVPSLPNMPSWPSVSACPRLVPSLAWVHFILVFLLLL